MRTPEQLYDQEHGDEMTMGQLAVLAEVRQRLETTIRSGNLKWSIPVWAAESAAVAVLAVLDSYAEEIVEGSAED
jgi:hypothetical protein